MTGPASVLPAWIVTLFCSVEPAAPATTQRPPLNRARAMVSGSGWPAILTVVVAHTGVAAALHTRRSNRSVFSVFGNVNASFEPVVDPSVRAGSFAPRTYVHWNVDAPVDGEPSRVTGQFCGTFGPIGAICATGAGTPLTCTTTVSSRVTGAGGEPSIPLTASVMVKSPGDVATNEVVFVFVDVSATPAGAVHAYPVMLPVESAPVRLTVVPSSTVWSGPALATSGSGGSAVPCDPSTGIVIDPPFVDFTVTASGGAMNVRSPAPVGSSVLLNAGTVSVPADVDLSLVLPCTCSVFVVESYVAVPVTRSSTGTDFTVCGTSPRLTTSTFEGSAPVTSTWP